MNIKTLIFDVNETLLDMSQVKAVIAEVLGSESLVPLWFSTLLHHSLVENSTARFHGFSEIGAASLVMVAHANKINVTVDEAKSKIVPAMASIPAHSDVAKALGDLKREKFTLVALSNSAQSGLNEQLRYAQIDHCFDHILSVETVKKYKPDPEVYKWAMKQIDCDPMSTMMVAAHGWDTSGAKAAGLHAAFVERSGKMEYPLGIQADISVKDIQALADYLTE